MIHAASGQATFQYQTSGDWGTGFNGQITFTNGGPQTISQWLLDFDWDRSINVIWNATIVSQVGNHYRLQSAGWNDQVAPNGTVTIGFGGSPGNVTAGPANFILSNSVVTTTGSGPTSSGATPQVTITESSTWSGGFTANLTLTNTGSQAISAWTLSFGLDSAVQSLWNGTFTEQGNTYQVSGAGSTASIPPGATVTLGFTSAGTLTASSASACVFNGSTCSIAIVLPSATPPVTPSSIQIAGVDNGSPANQVTVPQAATSYTLSISGPNAVQFSVLSNNPSVAMASISGNTLQITGLQAGRAGLQIIENNSGSVRFIGVRVTNADGTLPGLPSYLSLGAVSDDTTADLNFWQTFSTGSQNHRADSRYIYLNGGPVQGWDTWTNTPGGRAASYIRNSRMFGMIPIFVFYNIPDSSEGYLLDLSHAADPVYMSAYFTNLKLALDIIQQESPDDPVEMILEPDFLGYLAQNAGAPASAVVAATSAAYASGVLAAGTDPQFPNTVAGLVQAINYTISKLAPQTVFGWQFNLWASPAGGWTTSVPVNGLMHKTDTGDFQTGRTEIANEAAAIAAYYLAAGVATYGAGFVSIDKYGLDAVGFESSAATNPAGSIWFWNNDLWENYLTFAAAIHQTVQLPVVLWQLPVGHINSSQEPNPYPGSTGTFPDLADTFQQYEDSAPTFFFGDTFSTTGARLSYFSTNAGADPAMTVNGQSVTWGSHMSSAAGAGVVSILFGAGVGASTTNVGNPPTDAFWWITKAQEYLANPAPLPKK